MKTTRLTRWIRAGIWQLILISMAAAPAAAWMAVSAGGSHTCGIRNDGTVACWGYNQDGQATPPAGVFIQLGAGEWHTCGIQSAMGVSYPVCWGNNAYNQSPPAIPLSFTQVCGGEFTSCGLRSGGSALCWGWNVPGIGQTEAPSYTFVQMDCGDNHSCGVRTGLLEGLVACWGHNNYGQASPPSGSFSQVSGGNEYTCGVRVDGSLACWGTNTDGQTVPPSGVFKQVIAGGFHACGVRIDGSLACWGLNSSGQATPPAGDFIHVSAGGFHTCALRTNGTLTCWGSNGFGQAPAITLSPTSLPNGLIGQPYSQVISAAGGTAPHSIFLMGGNLPAELNLTPGGVLSGIPSALGTYGFTIAAADSNFFYTERAYSLSVTENLPTINLPIVVHP